MATTVVANPGVADAVLDQDETPATVTEPDIVSDAEKWYAVAIVLDRLFFTFFLTALVLAYVFTFPEPLMLFSL